jgi:ribosomal protein L11 methyltransferase
MYSLRLKCKPEEIDLLSAELYEAGTAGIYEIDDGTGMVGLIAGFQTNECRAEGLKRFASYAPEWIAEDAIDWASVSRQSWPAREVGERLFLAPPWSAEPTLNGRLRVLHNPGLACGTGEHPCTQLALIALEKFLQPGCTVVDVGAGSGLLAIAALRLGAARAIGVDLDAAALMTARENFRLNGLAAELICGSADVLSANSSDLTAANISGTVLLSIWEDLLRITRRAGYLILTGFPTTEVKVFRDLLPRTAEFESEGWVCFAAKLG